MSGINQCIFCKAESTTIGVGGLKPYEAYCPFCNATVKEYFIRLLKGIDGKGC